MSIDVSALGFKWDKGAGTVEPLAPKAREPRPAAPTSDRTSDAIQADAVAALRRVFDPEIPVNIYDLGLIYRLDTATAGYVEIDMTLTSPLCPVAGTLPEQVRQAVLAVSGVSRVELELVWDPAWDKEHMSEAARLELGM